MKKKLLFIPFTIIASVALFGPMASAGTITMNYGSRHYSNGGEFNASSTDFAPAALATMGYVPGQTIYTVPGYNTGFETFCVEHNEEFNPGSSYYYKISQAAVHGGVTTSDPISRGTAWLYLEFATGGLTAYGYNYTPGAGGDTSAGELQATIWWLEGEISGPPINNFTTAVMALPYYLANNNNYYHVGVLNLWVNPDFTGVAQDQLILTGSPTTFGAPDGGSTAMLLGLGLLGLFVGTWKLNRRSHAA